MSKLITITPWPSNSTVVFEQVNPTDPPLSGIGTAMSLTNFFDGGLNVAPSVVIPTNTAQPSGLGPGVRVLVAGNVKIVNPA